MPNVLSAPSELGGALHEKLGLILRAGKYLQTTGHSFTSCPNLGPIRTFPE